MYAIFVKSKNDMRCQEDDTEKYYLRWCNPWRKCMNMNRTVRKATPCFTPAIKERKMAVNVRQNKSYFLHEGLNDSE